MEDLYKLYMDDMFMEAAEEERIRESHILYKEVYPLVKKKLDDPANVKQVVGFVGSFISEHAEAFSAVGPIYKIPFLDKDINKYFDLFEINKEWLQSVCEDMVAATYPTQQYYHTMVNSPLHRIIFDEMLVYGLGKNNNAIVECCEYLFAFTEYPLVFNHYWNLAPPKKDVMEYTMEHLPNQFIIRRMNLQNILQLIKYNAHKSVETHRDRLLTTRDDECIKFNNRIRNAFNSSFKKISIAYYENWKNNATQHTQVDEFEDGTQNEAEGNITKIGNIASNTYNKFMTNGVESIRATLAAKNTGIDSSKLTLYLTTIKEEKKNRVKEFIESIVYLFFNRKAYDGSEVTSKQFFNFGLALYKSISLSKDRHSQNLNNTLDFWQDLTGLTTDTNRDATITNYRKAIFTYFILIIKDYN